LKQSWLPLTNSDGIIFAINMQKVDGHSKQKPQPKKLVMFTL
jgi:hypothetical protein